MSEKLTITVPATDERDEERDAPKAVVITSEREPEAEPFAAPTVTIPAT